MKNSEIKIQKKQSSFGFRNELINNSCIEVLEYVIFVWSMDTIMLSFQIAPLYEVIVLNRI